MNLTEHPLPLVSLLASGVLLGACTSVDERSRRLGPDDSSDGPTLTEEQVDESDGPSRGQASPDRSGADVADVAASASTCETPNDLGSMRGDVVDVRAARTVHGACTAWVRIVVEDGFNWLGTDLHLEAVLEAPDQDAELYAYMKPHESDDAALSCKSPVASDVRRDTAAHAIRVTWPDVWGENDSRAVTLEVRSRGAHCASHPWTLRLRPGLA